MMLLIRSVLLLAIIRYPPTPYSPLAEKSYTIGFLLVFTESTPDMLRQTTVKDVRQRLSPAGEGATWFAHLGLSDCASGWTIVPRKDQMALSSFSSIAETPSGTRAHIPNAAEVNRGAASSMIRSEPSEQIFSIPEMSRHRNAVQGNLQSYGTKRRTPECPIADSCIPYH